MSNESTNAKIIRVPGHDFEGRWLRPKDLSAFWNFMAEQAQFDLKEIGKSQEGRPIYALDWGNGAHRVLAWSQMHGNEPTASFALLDLCEEMLNGGLKDLHDQLSFRFIIMLNPDGAERFKRRNALGIDLNRDVLVKSAKESRLFFESLEEFKPHWAFNLHDQRSIFSAGMTEKTATLSFLAPSADVARSITPFREKAMQLIAHIHSTISNLASGHFGRYTDEFYPRALGDNLMKMGVPAILFEAGAFPSDPNRKKARLLIKEGLKVALESIASGSWRDADKKDYFQIPENHQILRDIVFRDLNHQGAKVDIALMLKEEADLDKGVLVESYLINDIGDLAHLHGIQEFRGGVIETKDSLDVGQKANFKIRLHNSEFSFRNGEL